MVGAALGKEGFELLPDGLDEVRWECGHGACSFRSGSLENSPHDGASVPALHHDALPIDGSSKENDRLLEGFGWLGPVPMGRTLDPEFGHLAFDHPRIATVRPRS